MVTIDLSVLQCHFYTSVFLFQHGLARPRQISHKEEHFITFNTTIFDINGKPIQKYSRNLLAKCAARFIQGEVTVRCSRFSELNIDHCCCAAGDRLSLSAYIVCLI